MKINLKIWRQNSTKENGAFEKYEVDGDFIESQAFAYLAIRSLEGMPISFPSTTRCKKPLTGGVIIKNF